MILHLHGLQNPATGSLAERAVLLDGLREVAPEYVLYVVDYCKYGATMVSQPCQGLEYSIKNGLCEADARAPPLFSVRTACCTARSTVTKQRAYFAVAHESAGDTTACAVQRKRTNIWTNAPLPNFEAQVCDRDCPAMLHGRHR